MTSRTLSYAVATALVASLALAGCKKDAPATDTAMTPPPMSAPAPTTAPPAMNTAPTISSVSLGKQAGADKTLAATTTQFGTMDPIIVSVATSGTSGNANIHTRLVYQDGQVAGEESQTITANGMDTTNFTFNNANGWPAGDYTAEVSVNNSMPRNTTFTVK